MAKSRPVKVMFPSGGEYRRGRYSQKTQPYTTPRAINVRGVGPLEERARGGVRPGLEKYIDNDFGTNITGISSVTYIDADGDRQQDLAVICDGTLYIVQGDSITTSKAYLTIDGDKLTIDGDYLIYTSTVAATNPLLDSNAFQMDQWRGNLYIADSTLQRYDPLTGVVATVDDAPTSQPLICIYQGRVVLAGEDHIFYMSAEDVDTDWDAGAHAGNVGRAVMGYVGHSGKIGEKILALHPYEDRALVFGCQDSVWALYGNPAGGAEKKNVSPFTGIIGPGAIEVMPDGLVMFLGRRGLYTWQIGSERHPEFFSKERVPEELLDVDTSTTDVMMKYDHRSQGVYLFLTPNSGVGSHWWINLETKAIWPVKLPATQQPLCATRISTSGYSDIILGCKDGYLRRFDKDATTDDGTAIESDLLLGPFHVSRAEGMDGMVTEMVAAFGTGSGTVTWKLVTADSAEAVVDKAETALDGDGETGVDDTGEWVAGQNYRVYPRSRGPWAVLWLSSEAHWSYEAITMFNRQLGRLR